MEVLIARASAWNTVIFCLEYCGILLEYCGVLLEYCGILPKVEDDLLPWTMFILTRTTAFV